MSRTIDKGETLRRMTESLSGVDLKKAEPVDLSSVDDHDLIMCFGTLLGMACNGKDVNSNDFLIEIRNRAKRYVTEMLMREGLIAYKEENHEQDD